MCASWLAPFNRARCNRQIALLHGVTCLTRRAPRCDIPRRWSEPTTSLSSTTTPRSASCSASISSATASASRWPTDGAEMRRALDRSRPDIVVLDLMLPGRERPHAVPRPARANPSLPVIMLTARGEEVDRIVGLEMGADDYLAKPFSPRELLARIRSILRRARGLPAERGGRSAQQAALRRLDARPRRAPADRARRRGGGAERRGVQAALGVRRASRTACSTATSSWT